MITRREVVTAGFFGSIPGGAIAAEGANQNQAELSGVTSRLNDIKKELEELNGQVTRGFFGNSTSIGLVGELRGKIELYLKTSGKFPDFVEVGTSVFYDVYDWHVRHRQEIQITPMSDQRMMIRFMFTQLILRWENQSNYIGAPYDRG